MQCGGSVAFFTDPDLIPASVTTDPFTPSLVIKSLKFERNKSWNIVYFLRDFITKSLNISNVRLIKHGKERELKAIFNKKKILNSFVVFAGFGDDSVFGENLSGVEQPTTSMVLNESDDSL